MIRGEATLQHLLSPIADLLSDSSITDIVIQKDHEVGFERAGKWLWRGVPEFDADYLDAIGIIAAGLMSKRFDPEHALCLTHLPGRQRFTAARPAATDPGIVSLTIRVPATGVTHASVDDWASPAQDTPMVNADDEALLELYRAQAWSFFWPLAVRARKNIVAIGRMKSGKTTFLRDKLMPHIPQQERVVTIEDTPEFALPHIRNRVSLYFGSAGISADDCFEATLRMGADRVAFQEIRGAEAFPFLRLLASGHSGSLTTWHADARDPWSPVVLMIKSSERGRSLPEETLGRDLKRLIDIVVFCYRDGDNYRQHIVYYRGATCGEGYS